MKKVVFAFALAAVLFAPAVPARADTLNVQVRSGKLREQPSFLGKIVAEVAYGDQLRILREQGEWRLGQAASGREGWIHVSALTDDEIVLTAGTGEVETGASSEELALAGKGFNAQIEEEYRAQNREIDFTWVDRMEEFIVSPEQMVGFLKMGQVNPPSGGVR
ncbi:MAG: SH3 domain-containing protein [Candidatus Erginobacter occultus]|nr:SH3 domain-containing protein [Candidatus Erginobacter occultus]